MQNNSDIKVSYTSKGQILVTGSMTFQRLRPRILKVKDWKRDRDLSKAIFQSIIGRTRSEELIQLLEAQKKALFDE